MRKKIMAVFDTEKAFVERLVALAGRERGLPFSVHGFTEPEKLADFCKVERVALLLAAESLLSEEIRRLPVGKLICLSEERVRTAAGLPAISRYQAARSLLSEAFALCGRDDEGNGAFPKGRVRVIGACSPNGRCGKTSLLLALGQQLARRRPSIFFTLEDFSGLRSLLRMSRGSEEPTISERGLSDILFLLRQGEREPAAAIAAAVQPFGRLDILPPAAFAGELRDVSAPEWSRFFDILREKTGYEAIFVDIGGGAGQLREILAECDRVYMPEARDTVGKAREEEFLRFLEREENRDAAENLCRIRLPKPDEEDLRRFPEQLEWSAIGRAARELLETDPVYG